MIQTLQGQPSWTSNPYPIVGQFTHSLFMMGYVLNFARSCEVGGVYQHVSKLCCILHFALLCCRHLFVMFGGFTRLSTCMDCCCPTWRTVYDS